MKEELISFETAKLASKKGLNIKYEIITYKSDNDEKIPDCCTILEDYNQFTWYDRNGNLEKVDFPNEQYMDFFINKSNIKTSYLAFSQARLQKWLRDKHGIHIEIQRSFNPDDMKTIVYRGLISARPSINKYNMIKYDTFEEALEVELQEGLKLIKI